MTPDRRPRPRSFAGALAQFHAEAAKSDVDLQLACSDLDLCDHYLVEAWGKPGHDERRAAFTEARAVAWRLNEAVTAAQLARAQENGRRNMAARKEAEA